MRHFRNNVTVFITAIYLICFVQNSLSQAWTAKSPLPGDERDQAMTFSLFGKGYICGGNNGTQILKDTWEYDPSLNVWTQKADMPQRNNGASAFTAGNYGYIVGGYNIANNELQSLWRFNPQTNNWNSKADFIGPRDNGALSWRLNNKGYFGCGWNGSNMTNDVWQYDPATDAWTQVSSFPGGPRAWLVCFYDNNFGYAGLGEYPSLIPHTDFYKYNPNTNAWSTCDSFPGTPRFWSAGLTVNGFGYTGCGATTMTNYLNDWWQYDLNNDEWKQVCDFDGGPLALFQGFVIGSDAYIIGGRDSLSNKLNTVWKFESNLMPQPFITSNNAGCAGDTTTLTVTGVASCVWNNGDTSHVISFVPTTPALYYVTSSNGACTLSDSIYIYVNTPPVTPVITGANDTLFSNSTGTYYQWYINGIPIIIGGNASYLAAPLPGTYTVYVSDANGCDAISLPFVFASINENADYENCIKSIIIHNQLQISWCENFTGSLTFELYSINGQLVYSNMINASQQNINIEVPIINKSFYLLRISNGNSTYNKKIVMVE